MRRWLQGILDATAGVLLAVLLGVGVLQVGSRYTNMLFVPWTEELARLLFVWVVWIGAAAAVVRGSHIRFDFLLDRLPVGARRVLAGAVGLATTAFLLLIAVAGYEIVRSTSSTFITLNLSVKYTYLSAVAGACLMLLGLAVRLTAPGPGKD
jgi:TRAP-type C4-dicarboxylate transport system permease small subunit